MLSTTSDMLLALPFDIQGHYSVNTVICTKQEDMYI